MRLTTFGGVGIRPGGAEGDPAGPGPAVSRRVLALLVLLAAAPDQGVSRETLAAYLWPESDDEHARSALRQALHLLRRELGQQVVTGGLMLRANPAVLGSDFREFDEARAAGDFERAIACYRGPFLDGFHVGGVPEFERWVDSRRAEYADRAAAVLESLARAAREQGDASAAVEWWRRRALLDPLDSRVAAELVRALATGGNRAGALRQAEAHARLLREELGTEPDAAFTSAVAETAAPAAPAAPAVPAAPNGSRSRSGAAFHEQLEQGLAGRYAIVGTGESVREGAVRIFAARDLRHDRPVTLRVIHPAIASRLDIERFLREIRLTARLQHPHVLPLLDSGEVGGHPWYAAPWPDDAESLRSRLGREATLPADQAVRCACELADALAHAHAHGVVHRDVSPENVLLAGGHALLGNLGVARALDAAGGPRLTETGMLIGTAAYMSPEQAAGDNTLDGRSDLYSLGAVLFEMLIGEPLFSGPTPQAIMAKRAAARPDTLRERLAAVPDRLARVLARALAPRPEDRFATAAAFAAVLATSAASLQSPLRGASRWRRWFRGLGL